MKFLKTTLLGGLFVLLPLMLLWIGLREIGGLLTEMAAPIADLFFVDLFPPETFDRLSAPGAVALIIIIGTSFILGLMAKSGWLSNIGHRIENSVLMKIPMYNMLKIISGALINTDKSNVCPALVRDGAGGGEPCYVMELHKDGRATVLLPWSPASFAGSIKVVHQDKLEFLTCSIDEFSRSLSFMGVGVEDCMSSSKKQIKQ
jgi:uncharacterized membrane protein